MDPYTAAFIVASVLVFSYLALLLLRACARALFGRGWSAPGSPREKAFVAFVGILIAALGLYDPVSAARGTLGRQPGGWQWHPVGFAFVWVAVVACLYAGAAVADALARARGREKSECRPTDD
jgi:hypothetical protein